MKLPEPRRLPSGSWFIQLRLGGESIPVTEPSRTACLNSARLIKAEYLAGREVQKKKAPPAPEMTLRELLDAYIKKYKPVLSPATVGGYATIRDTRFQAVMDKKLREISDWQAVINAETKAVAPKTVTNAWSLVASSLRDAKLPVPEVTLPQPVKKTRPWLSSEEIRRFVAAVKGSGYEIPIFLALLGLRRSELMALTWDRVDLKAGLVRVEGAVVRDENGKYVFKETNKETDSRRQVPIMIPELRAALEAVPQKDRKGRVVTCHIGRPYKVINKICEREGLPLTGVHGLRHSFASLGHHVGVPEQEMQLLGGWKDARTMHKIYEHIEAADLLRAQNAMAAFYASPAPEKAPETAPENAPENVSESDTNANRNANSPETD